MISITRASETDAVLLSTIAKLTFIESHGSSAKPEDINSYVNEKYTDTIFKQELSDSKNVYHITYQDEIPAGYSNIIFNLPYADSPVQNITKLERLYILEKFYNLKIGSALFHFYINLAKENNQMGIWLYVWKENKRAVSFYKKNGFQIIGSHDFKISQTHSNPNHQMLLRF